MGWYKLFICRVGIQEKSMIDITQKSTSCLIDELITTTFKLERNPTSSVIERYRLLDTAVTARLTGDKRDRILFLVIKLRLVLRECWEAQEVIMKYKVSDIARLNQETIRIIALAGIKAQETNAARNKLLREIDTLLDEYTTLEKTYG